MLASLHKWWPSLKKEQQTSFFGSWWSPKEPEQKSFLSSINLSYWWSVKEEPEQPSSWFSKEAAITTGAAIGTPTVVQSIVSALGFGVGGIAKGSIGAAMMSKAAIATGGGVAAGGIVPTLQSIGVLGLGTAAVPLAVTGATVTGGYLYWDSICNWFTGGSK